MQSPWLFFSPAMPTPHHHQKPMSVSGAGLIPIGVSPQGPPLLTGPPGPAFATYAPAHHHHHHPSQLLLAAAAAAAYGQQCAAAASSLLHPRQGIPNGGFHLKVDDGSTIICPSVKRKSVGEDPENTVSREIKKAKLETKALKAKRPGFTDERYNETSYYVENGLRKVYPYYFTFTTFTKGRWVGEKILDVFSREFRAHPVEEYERCIKSGTLTVNYTKVDTDYRLKHNDLLANIVHRHEVPVTSDPIEVVHMDEELVVVNKPASIPVHPCGRYRHNTVVFILAKEHQLKNLRTIHRLDRLTSGLLLFGRSPKKAREMEHQIRNRLVQKEYVCRVEGNFPDEEIECTEPIEVVSYKIGVCKVSKDGKDCRTVFKKLSFNGKTSVVVARPRTGRMHQIRVHLQFLGYPIVNDPLYNHPVFGPEKGKGGLVGKTDEELIAQLISIHNAENWLGIEGDDAGGAPVDIFGPALLPPAPGPTDSKRELDPEIEEPCPSSASNGIRSDRNPDEEPVPALGGKVTVGTQTGDDEPAPFQCPLSVSPSTSTSSSTCDNCSTSTSPAPPVGLSTFRNSNMTHDPHCYECKVRYRDPKPRDLVMFLHALSYRGPGWCYETRLPAWASEDWSEPEETL